jgi:hypothetical protein
MINYQYFKLCTGVIFNAPTPVRNVFKPCLSGRQAVPTRPESTDFPDLGDDLLCLKVPETDGT